MVTARAKDIAPQWSIWELILIDFFRRDHDGGRHDWGGGLRITATGTAGVEHLRILWGSVADLPPRSGETDFDISTADLQLWWHLMVQFLVGLFYMLVLWSIFHLSKF
jgi:hypothetical protein